MTRTRIHWTLQEYMDFSGFASTLSTLIKTHLRPLTAFDPLWRNISVPFSRVRQTKRSIVKAMLRGVNEHLSIRFHIYCLIWMKYGLIDLHMIFLSIYEFHERWQTEGHMLFMGLNEITFTHILWNRMLIRRLGMPWYRLCVMWWIVQFGILLMLTSKQNRFM